jgi:hypothetical protein
MGGGSKSSSTSNVTDSRVGIGGNVAAGSAIVTGSGNTVTIQDLSADVAKAALDANKTVTIAALDDGTALLRQIVSNNAAARQVDATLAADLVDKTTGAILANSQGAASELLTQIVKIGGVAIVILAIGFALRPKKT